MVRPEVENIEISRSVIRLRRIIEASKFLNSTLDLEELTTIILKLVKEETGVDRGSVFVVDHEQQQLRSIVAQGVEDNEIRVPLGQGIVGAVAATGEVIDIPDAYADSRFNRNFDVLLGYRTKDIFCMPIVNRENVIVAVLQLLNRSTRFTSEDLEFLRDISVHIGLALEKAWFHRQILEKRKIEQELELAREIQQNFYPNLPKMYGDVQISASNVMCEAVGGDYLDYYALPNGRFIVMLSGMFRGRASAQHSS